MLQHEEIRGWENECSECKRYRNKPATHDGATTTRLHCTFRAFDQTAVDQAGLFTTIKGHGHQRLKRWRIVQELISRVWSRWSKEYLPMHNTLPKWIDVVKHLVKGDVELVLEPHLPRGKWPLGRIVDTCLGEKMNIPKSRRFTVKKRLWCDQFKLAPLL